jgi:DNA-binding response OmpR family regulator
MCELKILIVDDDKAVHDLLQACLSPACEVIDTADPEQALALALEHKPDAILLDLMMPKFSGYELCQGFRSLSYTSAIPLIVIRGESDAKYKDHCANLGAVAYFEKPLKLDELKCRPTMELCASGGPTETCTVTWTGYQQDPTMTTLTPF